MIPSIPDDTSSDSFFTSSPARPKIACNNFSSGDNSLLLFGAILPTKISPGFTFVPVRITPFSSRFLNAFSETLGMSRVNSSLPNFVSLISTSNSSLCMEVNRSSFNNASLITIASSKLYPSHVMKATTTFLPRLNSPLHVAAPSAIISPFFTFCPSITIGF